MPAPIGEEVRWIIVKAIEDSDPSSKVAKTYRVSKGGVNCYSKLYEETGDVCPKPMGGDRRSQKN